MDLSTGDKEGIKLWVMLIISVIVLLLGLFSLAGWGSNKTSTIKRHDRIFPIIMAMISCVLIYIAITTAEPGSDDIYHRLVSINGLILLLCFRPLFMIISKYFKNKKALGNQEPIVK